MPTDVAAGTGHHNAGLRLLGDVRPRRRVPARLLRLASDQRLVEHVRAGCDAAFEAIFDRHHRGVLGFCRHMLGSVEEAEDAVQHTFLAVYRELVGSDKPILLRPWLYTIARNRCLTVLRTRAHQADAEVQDPPTRHLAAEVEQRHDLRHLLRDVAALPEEQRAALLLSEMGDMSHDEIADVLGCRREKVKALVFQARSSLIASRNARETPCAEIREQLANVRGGSLRRNDLRRHLSVCAGCREFREQVRVQRRDLALALPVAPTMGLKAGVVGAVLGGSAASAPAVGGGGAVAAKVLVVAAVAGGGTVAVQAGTSGSDPVAPPPPAAGEAAPATGTPAEAGTARYVHAPGSRGHATHAAAVRTRRRATPPGDAMTAPAPGGAKAAPPAKSPRAVDHATLKSHGKAAALLTATPQAMAKPAKPAKPVKPAKAVKQAKAVKPANAVKPAKPAKPFKPPQAAKPEKAVKPAKPLKPPKAAKPAQHVKPSKAAKPVKPPKAVKPAHPVTSPEPPTAKPTPPGKAQDAAAALGTG